MIRFTTRTFAIMFCTFILLTGATHQASSDELGVESFSGGFVSGSNLVRGFRFQAFVDSIATGLAVYDIGGDGLILNAGKNGVDVGLWHDDGTLLASAQVPGGTSATLQDGFRLINLANTVNLTSGQYYIVAADMSDLADDLIFDATPTTTNYIGNFAPAAGSSTLSVPNNIPDPNGSPTSVQLGGNVLLRPIPEPATFALGILGLISLGMGRRHR